jgi:hypothetical protein
LAKDVSNSSKLDVLKRLEDGRLLEVLILIRDIEETFYSLRIKGATQSETFGHDDAFSIIVFLSSAKKDITRYVLESRPQLLEKLSDLAINTKIGIISDLLHEYLNVFLNPDPFIKPELGLSLLEMALESAALETDLEKKLKYLEGFFNTAALVVLNGNELQTIPPAILGEITELCTGIPSNELNFEKQHLLDVFLQYLQKSNQTEDIAGLLRLRSPKPEAVARRALRISESYDPNFDRTYTDQVTYPAERVFRYFAHKHQLELERPQSALLLRQKFGIKRFDRYPLLTLIRQYDDHVNGIRSNVSFAIWATFDWNGGLSHHKNELSAIDSIPDSHTAIVEFDGVRAAVSLLRSIRRDYRQVKAIFVSAHGNPGEIELADPRLVQRPDLKTDQLTPGILMTLEPILAEKASILLSSCSTGASRYQSRKGFAEQLAFALKDSNKDITVIAPDSDASVKDMTYDPVAADFKVEFSQGESKRYRNSDYR